MPGDLHPPQHQQTRFSAVTLIEKSTGIWKTLVPATRLTIRKQLGSLYDTYCDRLKK
jgi:hypothetical protein